MHEEITALFSIDWRTFVFAVCAIFSAWMAASKVIDFLTEKIGIETKLSLRRKKMEKSISEIDEIKDSINELKELMTKHIEKDKLLDEEKRKELYKAQKRSMIVVKGKKIGRNEPCPCGSGKKYKFCCGR